MVGALSVADDSLIIDAVCLWDWLVSLKREWHLVRLYLKLHLPPADLTTYAQIWKSKWSVIKVLYLLCRYWVLFAVPYVLWVYVEDHSLETCLKIFRSPPALAVRRCSTLVFRNEADVWCGGRIVDVESTLG